MNETTENAEGRDRVDGGGPEGRARKRTEGPPPSTVPCRDCGTDAEFIPEWVDERGTFAYACEVEGCGLVTQFDSAEAARSAADRSLLEQERKVVESDGGMSEEEVREFLSREIVTTTCELRPKRCKCRFCESCARALGRSLRRKLMDALSKWDGILMITLTLDQTLFEGPEAAHAHLAREHAIGEFMRDLKRHGLVKSKRYFVVLEFQKNGWPHYHLLVEADFIPQEIVSRLWGRFRPKEAGAVAEGRPPLGWIHLSPQEFADASHATLYVSKYITKHPKHGWPQWVLESTRQIHRYSRSQGLFAEPSDELAEAVTSVDGPAEADVSAGDTDDDAPKDETRGERPKRSQRTIAERIASCGQKTLVMLVTTTYRVGECREEPPRYLGTINSPFGKIVDDRIGTEDEFESWGGRPPRFDWAVPISGDEAAALLTARAASKPPDTPPNRGRERTYAGVA